MDRISYIDNVVDFMHAETSTGLVKCVDLYNKVMMKFPEWNLVFNRHPYHNYISKTPSEEYYQLYCDRDDEYIKTRYDNEKTKYKNAIESMFAFRNIKATDSLFDTKKGSSLDRYKITKICYRADMDKYEVNSESTYYTTNSTNTKFMELEYLMAALLFYERHYVKIFVCDKNDKFDIAIFNQISNSVILESNVETIQFIEKSLKIDNNILFNHVFGCSFSKQNYEMFGKLNTSTYGHMSVNNMYTLFDTVFNDPEKMYIFKQLSGCSKIMFKNKLLYFALMRLERPLPISNLKTRDWNSIYIYLSEYKGFEAVYPSLEVIDSAIAVLKKRCNL